MRTLRLRAADTGGLVRAAEGTDRICIAPSRAVAQRVGSGWQQPGSADSNARKYIWRIFEREFLPSVDGTENRSMEEGNKGQLNELTSSRVTGCRRHQTATQEQTMATASRPTKLRMYVYILPRPVGAR